MAFNLQGEYFPFNQEAKYAKFTHKLHDKRYQNASNINITLFYKISDMLCTYDDLG